MGNSKSVTNNINRFAKSVNGFYYSDKHELRKTQMHPIISQFNEVIQGSYPEWVWQKHPKTVLDHIPIFTFHSIQPEEFEAQLQFLKENGYHTITSDMYYDYLIHGRYLKNRVVMLTFDDGRKSMWSYAYPLLKKFEMRATAFLISGIIDNIEQISPNLDDVWKGRVDVKSIEENNLKQSPTFNWKEIQVMHESHVIDFQCHSFLHQRIPVSPNVLGFVTPDMIQLQHFKFKIPFYQGIIPGKTNYSEYLGAPIYKNAPFFSDALMFLESKELRDRCIDYIKSNGGTNHFNKSRWQKDLETIIKHFYLENPVLGFESQSDQRKRMCQTLSLAKQTIEFHLSDHIVRHLAYPWGAGSDVAVQCSKQTGFVSNYWSTLPHQSRNNVGYDPFHLIRFKHDFIWRLPGKGRRSLPNVFLDKFKGRMNKNTFY